MAGATIARIGLAGFRSIADITMEPDDLTVIAGPNNAGKSTILAGMDFLADVFRYGIAQAIDLAGGISNVSDKLSELDAQETAFEFCVAVPPERWKGFVGGRRGRRSKIATDADQQYLIVGLSAAVRPDNLDEGLALTGNFRVARETLEIRISETPKWDEGQLLFKYQRYPERSTQRVSRGKSAAAVAARQMTDEVIHFPAGSEGTRFWNRMEHLAGERELVFNHVSGFNYLSWTLGNTGTSLRTYDFAPRACREPSPASPSATLVNDGGNLASAVLRLGLQDDPRWRKVERWLCGEVGNLAGVRTAVTRDRLVSLEFPTDAPVEVTGQEGPVAQAWTANEVSDGTILATALAVAMADQAARLKVFDEPERGLHAWLVRSWIRAVRTLSEGQIVVATHSPVILDTVDPECVLIAYMDKAGYTRLQPLVELYEGGREAFEEQALTAFEAIDGGAVAAAVGTP